MAKSTTMTVWMPPNISEKVALLAHDTKRTKAYLGGEAIASYVERNAWQIARIKASLDDARSGSPGVPHGEVERWVKSWDTENELPQEAAWRQDPRRVANGEQVQHVAGLAMSNRPSLGFGGYRQRAPRTRRGVKLVRPWHRRVPRRTRQTQ